MAVQFTSIPENSFQFGIDARSSENQILQGFVQDLLNADIVEERVRKRPGYQGFAGNLPFRALRLDYDDATNEVVFTLDSSASLENVRSSPIVIYGRSSTFTSGQGPFYKTADVAKYYSGFTVPLRKQITAPSGTLTVTAAEHGIGTTNLFASVLESTDLLTTDYSKIEVNSITVSESTFDLSIAYNTYVDRNVFVVTADKSTSSGSSYVFAATATGTGSQTISIPTATHNLTNYNIVAQIQRDTGASRVQVQPDTFVVDPSTGNVTITLTNGTGSSQDYYVLLSAAPVTNIVTGTVDASATSTVTISNLTSPWLFYGIYLEQTPGGNLELVIPESVEYSASTNSAVLTFINGSTSARNVVVYYEYGTVRSNQLRIVDASVTVSGSDSAPQLTIWGLDADEVYPTKSAREGWVTHVDAYRRSGEQRLVSGAGGVIYAAREYSEVASQYFLPLLYPSLSSRTTTSRILGPTFWDTGETPARSRGYITADASGTHWAAVTAVAYDSANTWTKYTLSLPSKLILDSTGAPTSLSSVISTTTDLEDWITIQGMSYSIHEGTFRIMQVQDGTNQIFVWVENSSSTNSDFDDSGVGGEASISTDQLTWSASSPYVPGDQLLSDVLDSDTDLVSILSSSSTVSVVDGITGSISVAGGIVFVGERTSNVIPLRSGHPAAASSVTNLVRGDMLSYTGINRRLRVLSINSDTDRNVTIAVSSSTATVTLGSGDTSFLSIGDSVLFRNAGVYTGVVVITAIPSSTTFEFSTAEDVSASGVLVGGTAEIDEQLMWADSPGDSTQFRVEERWIPFEAPDDSFDLTPLTHSTYFDSNTYSDQPFLRSTIVADNMYFTNHDDEVMKIDGSSIYRAGLFSWQPGFALTQETSGAAIVTSLRSIAYSAILAGSGRLTITAALTNNIPVGTSVRLTGSTATYTISSYMNDGTNFYVLVDRALDGSVSATGTLAEIGTYRYYYRLNAVDANNNVVASAVTGFQDYVVELTTNAAIQHHLVGLPAWDVYDYDRLEVQIYRTKINQSAPFYLVTTIPMDFDNTQGYVNYKDSFADTDLTNLDPVNTALLGTELGTSWSDGLRAKHITSAGNKLVLANVRDYPQLDIQVVGTANISDSTFAGDDLLFRRDDTDTGTTTSMPDRVRYQWINGTTGTASAFGIGTNQFSFTTSSGTSAVPGDWIYLTYNTVATTGRDLTYSGWWQIATVVTTTVTVNLVGAAAAASYPNRYVIATDPTDVPVLLGTDGNLGMVNGDSFDTFDAMRRMSTAINATMRMVDTTLTGMSTFIPWLVTRGGNDTPPAGRLIVRQPRSDDVTFQLLPTFSGYSLFVNSISRATGSTISASTRTYPSRILVSFDNYPEIFDSPTAVLDTDSLSAIDINSADGQEITGVIPFFGEAAFGAAQQSSVIVVFKSNSIYLVDTSQKKLGNNAVQRIETEGLGCTAPNSIAVTKGGIIFANESGIYCLRRTQAIQYIGRYMERNWTERVSLPNIDLAHGHHFGVGRSYKLSVPLLDDVDSTTGYVEPSEAYVYNHTGEDLGIQQLGAWSRYDNHPVIGWANLGSDAFLASTNGRVFSVRQLGGSEAITNFRDDSSAISMSLVTRPNDFGNNGVRKIADNILVNYRVPARSTGTSVSYAVDLEDEYQATTQPIIPRSSTSTGVDDSPNRDVVSIRHSLARRRFLYLSLEIENVNIDESVEVAGITYRIGGLTEKGTLQARGSQSK